MAIAYVWPSPHVPLPQSSRTSQTAEAAENDDTSQQGSSTTQTITQSSTHRGSPPVPLWDTLSRAPWSTVRFDRMAVGAKAAEALHQARSWFAANNGSFMYVSVMATQQGEQGRGLGSLLMQHLNALADRAGMASYVEATSDLNAGFYRNLGFTEALGTLIPAEGSPSTLVLIRRPSGESSPEA